MGLAVEPGGLAFFVERTCRRRPTSAPNAVNSRSRCNGSVPRGAEPVTPGYDLQLPLGSTWRSRAASVARSGHYRICPYVSCGTLPDLVATFSRGKRPRLRPPLPTAHTPPAVGWRGAPRAGRQPMPQHGFSCRGRESCRGPACASQAGRPTLPRQSAGGKGPRSKPRRPSTACPSLFGKP